MGKIKATDVALQEIAKLIISHKYKPGDRILETSLAQELNLSRTPIRDALGQLLSAGFLEKPDGQKGYIIPSLSPEDMKFVFQTRSLMEGEAAKMAARQATIKEIEVLLKMNESEMKAFYDNEKEKYANYNETFHLTIAKMTKNPYLYRLIKQVFWRSRLYIFFFAGFYTLDQSLIDFRSEHQRLSHIEHAKLIKAISEHKEAEAEQLMKEHISNTFSHLLNPQSTILDINNTLDKL